jgi:hypothetical protein
MAYLGLKEGVYHIRFRYEGRQFKRSLKTRSRPTAEAARHQIEQTLHRLHIGLISMPAGADPGEFIVSGGTRTEAVAAGPQAEALPATRTLIGEYLASQEHLLSATYRYSQGVHLRHLLRFLGDRADRPCDQLVHRDLERFLHERIGKSSANTANKERITLIQLFKWVIRQGYLTGSPAEV